jgi:hypothetical protein
LSDSHAELVENEGDLAEFLSRLLGVPQTQTNFDGTTTRVAKTQ